MYVNCKKDVDQHKIMRLSGVTRYEQHKMQGYIQMTQVQVFAIAADLINQGKTDEEIRAALFCIKGVRLTQIQKTMKLISA